MKNNVIFTLLITTLIMFGCSEEAEQSTSEQQEMTSTETTPETATEEVSTEEVEATESEVATEEITASTEEKPIQQTATPQKTQKTVVKNKWSKYTMFSDGKTVNLNEGKKIVCLYSLTCHHCQDSYKELCALSQQTNIPDTYIIFSGDKGDVPYFFEQAGSGCNHPFQIIPFTSFIPLMGEYSFPMIFLLEDGKQTGMWHYENYNFEEIKTAIKNW